MVIQLTKVNFSDLDTSHSLPGPGLKCPCSAIAVVQRSQRSYSFLSLLKSLDGGLLVIVGVFDTLDGVYAFIEGSKTFVGQLHGELVDVDLILILVIDDFELQRDHVAELPATRTPHGQLDLVDFVSVDCVVVDLEGNCELDSTLA